MQPKYRLLSVMLLPFLVLKAASNTPQYDHIVVVIEENHNYNQIIGSSSAPYINSLAQKGALFTNSNYIVHPSQPNYLAIFSGSTQGVIDDGLHPKFNAPNIGQALLAAGQTIMYYSEDLPSVGFDGEWSGNYARKHNAATQFSNVPETVNVPFSQFPTDFSKLPKISFVVPNVVNDAHSGTVGQMDTWLKQNIDPYAQWAVNNNSLLIITFDEPVGIDTRIPTLFFGANIKQGQYNESISHYTVLRVLEDAANVSYSGGSATVTPITDVWTTSVPAPSFSSSVMQNTNGSATLTFTALNWQSKSVQLMYSINNGAQQMVPTANNNNAWSTSIINLNSKDVVTYAFSYEWNGQTKTTTSQQFTYINTTADTSYTQSAQTVGQTVVFQFSPTSIPSSVILNYSLNGGAVQQVNLQSNSNNIWTFTSANLTAITQIAYNFTYAINGQTYTSSNFSYTYQPVTSLNQGAEIVLQLSVVIPNNTTPDYVVVFFTVNNGAVQEASMVPQCNNQWIHLVPSLKPGDQIAYSYAYSQNGQVQTSATFNFTVS